MVKIYPSGIVVTLLVANTTILAQIYDKYHEANLDPERTIPINVATNGVGIINRLSYQPKNLSNTTTAYGPNHYHGISIIVGLLWLLMSL